MKALKQILCLALCLVCVGLVTVRAMPVSTPATAATTAAPAARTPEMPMHLVGCVLRFTPSAGGKNIGILPEGAAVTIVGNAGNYYEIDCYGMTAYILKSQVQTVDGTNRVACDPNSADTVQKAYTPHGQALEMRHGLLALAKQQLGKPYIYGSIGTKGFDCSGLMYYLYGQYGVSLNRTASQQLADGVAVPREGMQVGDLVFFRVPWETYPASHVGIYAGDNTVIHAGHRGVEWVELKGEYFDDYFLCARRVICTGTVQQSLGPGARMGRTMMPAGGVSGRTVNGS